MTTFEKIDFVTFCNQHANDEGLVLLGAGGDLREWINGTASLLVTAGIAPANFQFKSAHLLETTGGRRDLVLMDLEGLDIGKLAMWRIQFGDCSWLSDWFHNYADQYGVLNEMNGLDFEEEDDA